MCCLVIFPIIFVVIVPHSLIVVLPLPALLLLLVTLRFRRALPWRKRARWPHQQARHHHATWLWRTLQGPFRIDGFVPSLGKSRSKHFLSAEDPTADTPRSCEVTCRSNICRSLHRRQFRRVPGFPGWIMGERAQNAYISSALAPILAVTTDIPGCLQCAITRPRRFLGRVSGTPEENLGGHCLGVATPKDRAWPQ